MPEFEDYEIVTDRNLKVEEDWCYLSYINGRPSLCACLDTNRTQKGLLYFRPKGFQCQVGDYVTIKNNGSLKTATVSINDNHELCCWINRKIVPLINLDIIEVQRNILTIVEGELRTIKKTVWEKQPEIEITVKVNGKEFKLSDISEDTLLKIREAN